MDVERVRRSQRKRIFSKNCPGAKYSTIHPARHTLLHEHSPLDTGHQVSPTECSGLNHQRPTTSLLRLFVMPKWRGLYPFLIKTALPGFENSIFTKIQLKAHWRNTFYVFLWWQLNSLWLSDFSLTWEHSQLLLEHTFQQKVPATIP